MLTPTVFTYQGNPIAFDFGDGHRMINAAEMAKPFNKTPNHFLRNRQTQNYINELARFANLQSDQIVRVINGGQHYGTWMHEKLALKFAAWLSPQFELWVFDRIQELLLRGYTQLPAALPAQDDRLRKLEEQFSDMQHQFERYKSREDMKRYYLCIALYHRDLAMQATNNTEMHNYHMREFYKTLEEVKKEN